jgi:hypothetical protein
MRLLKKLRSLLLRKKRKTPEEEGAQGYNSSLGRDWDRPPESRYFSPDE